MRVGIVGLGSIGRRHLGNLLDLGCVVVGMDVSPEAQAKAAADFPSSYIVDAIPFHGLDALVIATPAASHLRWVEEALARKLPFFTEKPLGTLDQLPRWREIAAMDLPVQMVGYNWRFNPEVLAWRQLWLGRAVGLSLRCDTNIATWPGKSYGNPALECSHEHNLLQWLYEPAMEHCFEVDVRTRAIIPGRWYRAMAPDGTVYTLTPSQESIDASYRLEINAFVDAVKGAAPSGCSLREALDTMETYADEVFA